ncbi:Myc-type, basic helix-loop-helix (bHLH) domain-containing protein [Cynara cardunculus var. scolymus]|uniref:Myc-type, basic helix-loop-helix (BHLH) domain-containing protein n=2 Tax=Cynara cardunculus var. scolymus TaxID=59895 RepID=A0A103YGZ5_CYNCS|nr:Myc-type, basic helix-loop-helix (bHLH) domain-containing protein [Cynara cardunculus var. scolymus]
MEEPHDFVNGQQQIYPYYSDSMNSFSSETFKGHTNLVNQSVQTTTINEDPSKHQDHKVMKTSPFAPSYGSSSNTFTISFGNLTLPPQTNPHRPYGGSKLKYSHAVKTEENTSTSLNEFHGSMEVARWVPSTSRNPRQAQEHVFAERKRREKLAQRFISLYALLPQLKKMDKATVLEDASKYIKELQKQVKELEETQVKGKRIIQNSTVSIGRSKLCGDPGGKDNASSSKEIKTLSSSSAYDPEIVVRISGCSTLVRIYCQRNPSLVLIALTEMERLHLAVISSNVLPFSNTDLLITITAQMSDELLMTAMDLVKCLQSALRYSVTCT